MNAFWHATLFRTPLVEKVFDGNPSAIRDLLAFQLTHWAGPKSRVMEELLDHMVETYSAPGAFTAGISWFRHDEGNPISAYAAEPSADPAQSPPFEATPTRKCRSVLASTLRDWTLRAARAWSWRILTLRAPALGVS